MFDILVKLNGYFGIILGDKEERDIVEMYGFILRWLFSGEFFNVVIIFMFEFLEVIDQVKGKEKGIGILEYKCDKFYNIYNFQMKIINFLIFLVFGIIFKLVCRCYISYMYCIYQLWIYKVS